MYTDNGCVFCQKIREETNSDLRTISYHGRDVISFIPLNPVIDGHRLFIPYLHNSQTSYNPINMSRTYQEALAYGIDSYTDFNLIQNIGSNASQTINHFHIHYVPRRPNDGLILPWTNQHSQKKPAL